MQRFVVPFVGCLVLGLSQVDIVRAQNPGLRDVTPATYSEIPKLIEQLKDKNKDRRLVAIAKLGKRGELRSADVAGAVSTLCEMATNDSDDLVREWSARALGMILLEPEKVVPLLGKIVEEDKNLTVRRTAAAALGTFGPASKPALGALREAQALGQAADKEFQEAQRNKTKVPNEAVRRAEADLGRTAGEAIQAMNGIRR
jgi:HEAT repeat protein